MEGYAAADNCKLYMLGVIVVGGSTDSIFQKIELLTQ